MFPETDIIKMFESLFDYIFVICLEGMFNRQSTILFVLFFVWSSFRVGASQKKRTGSSKIDDFIFLLWPFHLYVSMKT